MCRACKKPERIRACLKCGDSLAGMRKIKFCFDCGVARSKPVRKKLGGAELGKLVRAFRNKGNCVLCGVGLNGTIQVKYCLPCRDAVILETRKLSNAVVNEKKKHSCPKCGRSCRGKYCRSCRNNWL